MVPRRSKFIDSAALKLWVSLLFGAGACFGQASASLTGIVSDSSGSVIPGAKVVLTNTNTRETRTATSGGEGRYTFSLLIPGSYQLEVEAGGFKKTNQTNITLLGGQDAEVNVKMEVGAVTESVEVQAQAASLDTQTANQNTNITTQQVTEVPVNFRNPTALVFGTAGVKSMVGQTGIRSFESSFLDGDLGLFAMNGGREGSNTVWIDGLPDKAGDWGQMFGTPQIDAVQEVQIMRNTYDAEYGNVGNGVVNIVTRGGSPAWHGDAFEFLRNSDLDANLWEFNKNGVPKSPLHRNQFGGVLSGPVWTKRQIFFLLGYERDVIRENPGDTVTVPTVLQRQGNFSQTYNSAGALEVVYDPNTTVQTASGQTRTPFPGNIIPANRMDTIGYNVVNKLLPLPNRAGSGFTNANNFFGFPVPGKGHRRNVDRRDGRIDYAVTEKYSTFVHVSRNDFTDFQPRIFNTGIEDTSVSPASVDRGGPDYEATWSNTFVPSPRWVINGVIGVAGIRAFSRAVSINDGVDLTSLGYSQAFQNQFPALGVGSWSISNYLTAGAAGQSFSNYRTNSGSVNVTHELGSGSHSLKFGFSTSDYYLNSSGSQGTLSMSVTPGPTDGPIVASNSSTTGNSIASLLLGLGTGSSTVPIAPASANQVYGLYAQDAWKVSPRLTITVGMRYEVQTPRTERFNRENHYDPNIVSPLAALTGLPLKGGLVFATPGSRGQTATDWHNVAPRLGVAYKITDKLVMRTGYGISYARTLIDNGINGNNGYASVTQWTTSPGSLTPINFLSNPYPQGLTPATGNSLGAATFVGNTPTAWVYNNPTPYVENYSIDLQYQLTKSSVVEVGYTGNQGRKLAWGFTNRNLNQLNPQYLNLGQQLNTLVPNPFYGIIASGPLSGTTIPYSQLLLPDPQFTGLTSDQSAKGASSSFNALTAKVTHRFSGGLTYLMTYQWSKALDNSSEDQGWWLSDGPRNIYDPNSDRSISAHDVPQDMVNNLIYELPVGKGRKFGNSMGKVPEAILGGWQVSGVVRFASGTPIGLYAPNTLSAYGFALQHPNVTNVAALSLSNPTPAEWFNTSALSAPGTFQIGDLPRYLPNVRLEFMKNADLALMKNIGPLWHERVSAELRAEAFNAFNTPLFGIPSTNVGSPQEMLGSPSFGTITSTFVTGSRNIQLALKLKW